MKYIQVEPLLPPEEFAPFAPFELPLPLAAGSGSQEGHMLEGCWWKASRRGFLRSMSKVDQLNEEPSTIYGS